MALIAETPLTKIPSIQTSRPVAGNLTRTKREVEKRRNEDPKCDGDHEHREPSDDGEADKPRSSRKLNNMCP